MRKGFFFLLFLGVIGLQAQPITLKDAIDAALVNNYKIKAGNQAVMAAKMVKRKQFGLFFPDIILQSRYTHLNDEIVLDLNPIREGIIQLHAQNAVDLGNLSSLIQTGVPLTPEQRAALFQQAYQQLDRLFPSFSERLKKQNYWSGQIQVVQPVWTWGKITRAYQIAGLETKIKEQELNRSEQELIAEVVQIYFSNLLLESLLEVKMQSVQSLTQHEYHARRMAEEGLISRVEYLRAATALAKEKAELENVEQQRLVARQYLQNKIGVPFDSLEEEMHFPVQTPPLDSILFQLHNQPYLQMLSFTSQKLDKKIKIDLAEYLPSVYAFGQYELFKDDLSLLEPEWAVGIGVSWNIFHGFQKLHQHQADRYLKKQVEFEYQDLSRQLEIAIRKKYAEMLNAKNHYHALETTLELARENLRLNRKKFETGLGTSLEVIDAEITLRQVEIARLNEIYRYNSLLAEILALSGQAEKIRVIF